jgi:hypothetical protein
MQKRPFPPPTRHEPVEEVLHGVRIADPYRWLEDGDSPETQAWVEQQNAYTRSVLDQFPGRGRIHSRLEELLSIGVVGAPAIRGDRAFYVRREGRQNQPVLLLRQGAEEQVLVDPNALDPSGLTTLDWWRASPDGTLLAYGVSQNGVSGARCTYSTSIGAQCSRTRSNGPGTLPLHGYRMPPGSTTRVTPSWERYRRGRSSTVEKSFSIALATIQLRTNTCLVRGWIGSLASAATSHPMAACC